MKKYDARCQQADESPKSADAEDKVFKSQLADGRGVEDRKLQINGNYWSALPHDLNTMARHHRAT
jgi:hypothetical protein